MAPTTFKRTATCRSLITGEVIGAWAPEEDALHECAHARMTGDLSRPGARVRIVGADGSCLTGPCTWAELFETRGAGGPRPMRVS